MNKNNQQLPQTGSINQNDANEIDFDKTTTPSVATIVTHDGYSPLSASLQTISDTEQRYQLTGNINVINQL